MKRNVSVVCVFSAPNCCDTGQRSASQPASQPVIKEMAGSVASGTFYIIIAFCVETVHAESRSA